MDIIKTKPVDTRVMIGFKCDHCQKSFIYDHHKHDNPDGWPVSSTLKTTIRISDFGGYTDIHLCNACEKLIWDFFKANNITYARYKC
jgi:hypothetical protein